MDRYEILDHPSELRIRVYGKSPEGLFENAARALAEILYPKGKEDIVFFGDGESFDIFSTDQNAALIDLLNFLLAKSEIDKAVCLAKGISVDFQEGEIQVRGQVFCHPVEKFAEGIKAVTYQDVDIVEKEELWQTDIVFDV